MKVTKFTVKGMHCGGCKLAVEKALLEISGVKAATANPKNGECSIEYDDIGSLVMDGQKIRQHVSAALQNAGYSLDEWEKNTSRKVNPLFIWAILLLLFAAVVWLSPVALPAIGQIPESVGLGALFGLGLVTSLHCIGMCGGINLSVTLTTKMDAWRASAAYNLGRLVSYTLVGALLGAIGGTFNMSMTTKGLIAIAASLLMLMMAIKQIGMIKNFSMPNWIPSQWISSLQRRIKPGSMPFLVGIINALMPCGPLQAMQLYALSTGEWWLGALGMFVFSLGTVPLMFLFGLSAATIGKRFTKPLRIGSAVLLMLLALISLQRGMALAGPSIMKLTQEPPATSAPLENATTNEVAEEETLPSGAVAVLTGDEQVVSVAVTPSGYQDIVLMVNVPAKITFVATDRSLTSCNEAVIMPDFDIQVGLMPGETTVTFTPTQVGDFNYSCWMGMLNNTVHVVEALPKP